MLLTELQFCPTLVKNFYVPEKQQALLRFESVINYISYGSFLLFRKTLTHIQILILVSKFFPCSAFFAFFSKVTSLHYCIDSINMCWGPEIPIQYVILIFINLARKSTKDIL